MASILSSVAFSATLANINKCYRPVYSPWNSQSHLLPNDVSCNQSLFFSTTTTTTTIFRSSCTTITHASPSFEFDLSPPPIDHDLLDTMEDLGAEVSDDGTVETFGNDDEAFNAATTDGVAVRIRSQLYFESEKQPLGRIVMINHSCAVVDLTHFGRIRVSGEDRVQFLHNQTTANFENLREGQGCDTVFVTPTARTIDIAHAWIMKNAITLVVSPVTCQSICEMLTKYIFFADKVEVQDMTKKTCFFSLIGPKSNKVMEDLNLEGLIGKPYGTHKHFSVNGMPITVGVGNLISEEGFSFLLSPAAAGSVWKTLISLGAVPLGANGWERLRIFQGRPAPGNELTNEFNVLEAGLWNAVSLDKGCYKGQETVSRLITYDGLKQRLWGINLSAPAEPGCPIIVDGRKVGKLTSYTTGRKESEHFGLGYIKRQAASAGDEVNVGDVVGKVVEVPFLARQQPPLIRKTN